MSWSHFSPIDGINQLVGHTLGQDVRIIQGVNNDNLCLDVGYGEVAAILEGGKIQILKKS